MPFPAIADYIEFLYVNANEGSASGGHAAIKFGKEVFHFQHIPSGLLCIYRNDFSAFEFAYALRENRTIRAHRIEVPAPLYQVLREAFKRRLLIQNQQLALRQAMQDDNSLLIALKNLPTDAGVELKALGYFLKSYRPTEVTVNTANPNNNGSPQLIRLHRQIRKLFGENYLLEKRQQNWDNLKKLKPGAPLDAIQAISPDRFRPNLISFAQQYKNHLLNIAAIDALVSATPPNPATFLKLALPEFKLSDQQIALLSHYRDSLYTDLITLMGSERPDWGYPVLVALARCYALEASIQQGYWVVLNTSRAVDNKAPPEPELVPAALQYSQQLLSSAHKQLAGIQDLTERSYAEIERSVAALMQIKGLAQLRQLGKLKTLSGTPAMAAKSGLVQLQLSPAELDEAGLAAEKQLESYTDKLQTLYGYDLFSRNCVTEIFNIINTTVANLSPTTGAGTDLVDESKRWLGGHIGKALFNFIPFMAFDQVGHEYRVHSSYALASYRERQIQDQYLSQPEWLVDMRESNTLSSSIYHWNDDDAAFLFFTQDLSWQRPLLGSANFAVASGQMVYGMLSWPWDFGRNWQKGIKGMLVSIPELLFFNIRKGTFPNALPNLPTSVEPLG